MAHSDDGDTSESEDDSIDNVGIGYFDDGSDDNDDDDSTDEFSDEDW
jgi:hypothetical protein